MIAKTQYRLSSSDLETVLALVRAGTLAGAGERLGANASTVFRAIQRIERGIGTTLFVRSRSGYAATDLARVLAEQAEQIESALEVSRSVVEGMPGQASGVVRLTTTDSVLQGLLAPALPALMHRHPRLELEFHTGNELANLTRRDADIAVRATRKPPPHLVGRKLGRIQVAVYALKGIARDLDDAIDRQLPWVAPDDALPAHPSVQWRRRAYPRVTPRIRVDSVLAVARCIASGAAVGALPLFIGTRCDDLVALTSPIEECETDLWLLTHPESRHLTRISTVYGFLADSVSIGG
jgi:DNA-binding transcriptional LysR family regulator